MIRNKRQNFRFIRTILASLLMYLLLDQNYSIYPLKKASLLLIFVSLWWLFFGIKTFIKYFVIVLYSIVLLNIYMDFRFCLLMSFLCGLVLVLIKVKETEKIFFKNDSSNEKFSYYQSLGMSDSEIELFRSTMDKAQRDIKAWESNVIKSAKLKAIDMRTEGLKAAKSLFQELVRSPKRLSMAGDFLNVHLDAINDLTLKYLTIDNHAIKSKETIKTLQNSIEVIEQLSLQIVKDYTDFVADDIAEMNADIDLTKQKIKKKENDTKSFTDIHDILQADIDG